MSVIAGWICADGASQPQRECEALAASLARFSKDEWKLVRDGVAALAAAGDAGRTDRPAIAVSQGERFLVCADARIDNRQALIRDLGLRGVSATEVGDADLLRCGWEEWGEKLLDQLVGDFSFAIYDCRNRRLHLARDPAGQRPLFYSHRDGSFAFSSMAGSLAAHKKVGRGWNYTAFARALSDQQLGDLTYFEGVSRLPPGHVLTFEGASAKVRRFWNPDFEPLQLSNHDFEEAYRTLLEDAVKAMLTGLEEPIATHLSAGWDSTAVALMTARQRSPNVIAFTSAPHEQFVAEDSRHLLADESPMAARVAAFLQIEHRIVRDAPLTHAYLRSQARNYEEPVRNLINAAWNDRILGAARQSGAEILLNGQLGNLTLNAGGLSTLPSWPGGFRWIDWWKQARGAASRPDVSWKGTLFHSFQPWLPLPFWRQLRRSRFPDEIDQCFLNPNLERLSTPTRDLRPLPHPARNRFAIIERLDPGVLGKGDYASHAIRSADPFSDRRLMEFSLRLPPEQMLDSGVFKPLAGRALRPMLPAEFFNQDRRGVQSADWHLRFRQDEARLALDDIAAVPTVSDILDLGKIRAAIDNWPTEDWADDRVRATYSVHLPRALAAGVFIATHDAEMAGKA